MYKSFGLFSVSDERELRDPERIRRLDRERNNGLRIAYALSFAGGLACLALGVYGAVLLGGADAQPELSRTLMGVGFFFGAIGILMGAAFRKEVSGSPLANYPGAPQRYDFVKGLLTEANYLSDGKRSSAKMLVKGTYGEKGLFFEEFEPGAWSRAVAERGEEALKPGDDRYDQKGKRARLPIEVWVLAETGGTAAALAGIPAETAARLARKPR